MKPVVADFHTRVLCLRIETVPLDLGSPSAIRIIRLTHHPRDIKMSNDEVYLSSSGYDFTAYTTGTGMSPGMIDLQGIAGLAGIGYDEISAGVFDNARAYLFATSWATPVEDEEPIVASIMGKTTLMDDVYKIEEMSLIDALNQSVGETYTTSCPKKFGGQEYAGCKVNLGPITVTGTLTDVTDDRIVRDSSRAEADDYFAVGTIRFITGQNADLKPLEIKSYSSDGTIETYEPFHFFPEPGDQYEMIPGCRKRQAEDCFTKWNNVVNFGGFMNIPTQSQYTQPGTK